VTFSNLFVQTFIMNCVLQYEKILFDLNRLFD